ncbi:MAG: hypothetical protein PHR35_09515 [Kiritimatiellae bacterium]|nr:hypothetical protein [Kiritimatiellia bacterium]
MDLRFLYPSSPDQLTLAWGPKWGLYATQTNVVRAGYAAVLLPYSDGDGMAFSQDTNSPNCAVIRHAGAEDYVVAQPVAPSPTASPFPVETDARFALVRAKDGRVQGYAMSCGSRLAFRGEALLACSSGSVYAVNDGRMCRVDAPQGAAVEARLLTAGSVICNRETVSQRFADSTASFTAPVLPKEWTIAFADDGRTVMVSGDGPRPLRILAPKAIKCLVNGVSVYFSRAQKGQIYPKLETTEPAHGDDPGRGSEE